MKTADIKAYLEKNLSVPVKNIKRCKKIKLPKGQIIRSFLFTGNSVAMNAVVITDPLDTQILDLFTNVSFNMDDTLALKGIYSVTPPSIVMADFYFAFQAIRPDGEWDFNSFVIILKKTWDKENRWDDTDPAVNIVDDTILVQTMGCVYKITDTEEATRKWLLANGATENPAILSDSGNEEDTAPSENFPLTGFYFARFLNISQFGDPPTEDDSVILVEKSHWDTHKTWITRAGQSGAELTQEQNRGLPLMPFMHYVHEWETGFEWQNIKGFLEAAGATENNGLQTTMIMRNTASEDFILEALYPHEPVSQDPLSKAAYQIVEVMLTGEEDGDDTEEMEEMLWETPDKFLMWVAAHTKGSLDKASGKKIIKALNIMMAVDIVWEDFSTTWSMGMNPEGGNEGSKQTMVNEILEWATGKLIPADYGRKDDDPSDYLRD